MKSRQDKSTNPPHLRGAGSDESGPDASIARRRILLKAAASSPMVFGVSRAGAVAAAGSAYRAAANDAAIVNPPGLPEGDADTWLRTLVPYGNIVAIEGTIAGTGESSLDGGSTKEKGKGNSSGKGGGRSTGSTSSSLLATEASGIVHEGVYEICGKYYLGSAPGGDPLPFDQLTQRFERQEDRWVLTLFSVSESGASAEGVWPRDVAGGGLQGLHESSWNSFGTGSPPQYSCSGG